jgi:hypothetical protein
MPTWQEMVDEHNDVAPPAMTETSEQRTWRLIKGEWLPFAPPRVPASGLSLAWLWRHVLDEDAAGPSAEEVAAAAAEEDRTYPECESARYRRAEPDWLAQKVAWNEKYYGHRAWFEMERALAGGRGLPGERLAWLQTHESAIRDLIATARARTPYPPYYAAARAQE